MNKLTILVIIMFAFTAGYSQIQESELTIHITKSSEKLFIKNDDGYKSIEFEIEGLESENAANKLIEEALKSDYVIDFSLIPATFDNKRKVTAILIKKAKLNEFKKLLLNLGITTLIINGETVKTVDLIKWKEEKASK